MRGIIHPFGMDSMVYTFEKACQEFPELEYGDGLRFIYFNITGKKNVTRAQKELLAYLNRSKIENVTNDQVAHIHDYVRHVKQSAEVREHYMTIGEMMDMSKAEGEQSGLCEGLISILEDFGPLPEELQDSMAHADKETLKCWMKLAAKAESLQEFMQQINK